MDRDPRSRGRRGGGGGQGGRELYLVLQCHYQNDFCIKMGDDVSVLMFH